MHHGGIGARGSGLGLFENQKNFKKIAATLWQDIVIQMLEGLVPPNPKKVMPREDG